MGQCSRMMPRRYRLNIAKGLNLSWDLSQIDFLIFLLADDLARANA